MSVLHIGSSINRGNEASDYVGPAVRVASGSSSIAKNLEQRIHEIRSQASSSIDRQRQVAHSRIVPSQRRPEATKSVEEQLYDALAAFKVRTATVAMYMDHDWRSKLFSQLDSLLDADEWDGGDLPPTLASFSTFLRMLLRLKPDRRPGLAASSAGNLIATWTVDKDRLTIECLPNDEVRWVLSRKLDGETERAAGVTLVVRLHDVLAPYDPAKWFARAIGVP